MGEISRSRRMININIVTTLLIVSIMLLLTNFDFVSQVSSFTILLPQRSKIRTTTATTTREVHFSKLASTTTTSRKASSSSSSSTTTNTAAIAVASTHSDGVEDIEVQPSTKEASSLSQESEHDEKEQLQQQHQHQFEQKEIDIDSIASIAE